MARINKHRHRNLGRGVGWIIGCVLIIGCRESNSSIDISGAPFVHVVYQGQPLGDVQVRLHASRGGPVLAQSISRQDGNAYFTQFPSPEPAQYFVTVESLSDGGWMLDTKACQPLTESTRLESLQSSPQQRLEIPAGAVEPLSSPKRR